LQPEEVKGGTFTLTNHGVSGSLLAMPIINQPQSGNPGHWRTAETGGGGHGCKWQ